MSLVSATCGGRGDPLLVFGDGVLAPHPSQNAVRSVLHGQVEVRHELGTSEKQRTRSGDRSIGCEVVNRIRSTPGTAATRWIRSANEQPPAYEFTFWPISVTSRTPTAARDATSWAISA